MSSSEPRSWGSEGGAWAAAPSGASKLHIQKITQINHLIIPSPVTPSVPFLALKMLKLLPRVHGHCSDIVRPWRGQRDAALALGTYSGAGVGSSSLMGNATGALGGEGAFWRWEEENDLYCQITGYRFKHIICNFERREKKESRTSSFSNHTNKTF